VSSGLFQDDAPATDPTYPREFFGVGRAPGLLPVAEGALPFVQLEVTMQSRRYRPGPKGFRRSDERIQDEIATRLMSRDDIDSSEVVLQVKDARVTLEGTVPERWMRFAIDDVAESVMGVEEVENNVRVQRTADTNTARAQAMGATRQLRTDGR
jgi:BON domain